MKLRTGLSLAKMLTVGCQAPGQTGENSLSAPLSLMIVGERRLVVSDTGSNQLKFLPKGAF